MTDRVSDRPLRICLFTTRALPKRGGQEVVVDALAREFVKLGHYVIVLAPKTGRPHDRDSALPYPIVRHPRFLSTRWFVWWYCRYLIRLHRTHHFDVVHCHGVYPAGYLASLCRDQLRLPLVLTNHSGNLELDPAWVDNPTLRKRHLRAFASADALIAISKHTADLLRRLAPENPQIVTIPNGVALDQFDMPQPVPRDLAIDITSRRYLLFLGRLRRSKGVDLAIKALAQLTEHECLSLVVGGAGRDEESLKSLARQCGVEDRVKFVGWISGSAKAYLLQNALCAVVPSRESEGFGLVTLESYAAGRPVVVSRVLGLSELVSDGQTGLLFDPDSVESLVETLQTLITDQALANKLGSAGNLFAQSYRWSAVADQHLRLYRSLCTSPGMCRRDSVASITDRTFAGNHHASPAHS